MTLRNFICSSDVSFFLMPANLPTNLKHLLSWCFSPAFRYEILRRFWCPKNASSFFWCDDRRPRLNKKVSIKTVSQVFYVSLVGLSCYSSSAYFKRRHGRSWEALSWMMYDNIRWLWIDRIFPYYVDRHYRLNPYHRFKQFARSHFSK